MIVSLRRKFGKHRGLHPSLRQLSDNSRGLNVNGIIMPEALALDVSRSKMMPAACLPPRKLKGASSDGPSKRLLGG
jgi:hypothetical protein